MNGNHAPASFNENAAKAISDTSLQMALSKAKVGFVDKRKKAVGAFLGDFEQLRDAAQNIKAHTLKHLDLYLAKYEQNVLAHGGHVHWAQSAEDAQQIVLEICQQWQAKHIVKGKSMISEEIHLNAFLEKHAYEVTETDLGEYIIQLRGETPSHIIAPAVHLNASQIADDFKRVHTHLDTNRPLESKEALLAEARAILREKFLQADVGITGANFLIAENGTSVIVTNEGNGDLCQSLAKVHIVLASLEKVVPTFEDVSVLLRALTRSATGQSASVYTTFSNGPRRIEDLDGPQAYHVILLDNGRSNMLGSNLREMLSCIRCGACINHCPVYHSIGGHAYGAVYPGPMGSVLSPTLFGLNAHKNLPFASTFCGKCESVCPVKIPLPKLLRHLRTDVYRKALNPFIERRFLYVWQWLTLNPALYNWAGFMTTRGLGLLQKWGILNHLPLVKSWIKHRDFPNLPEQTFQEQWRERNGS